MCLEIVRQPGEKLPKYIKILEEDMKVWKAVRVGSRGDITTPYRLKKIRLGKQYRVRNIKARYPSDSIMEIHQGFHSLVEREDVNATVGLDFPGIYIVECTIPKGSQIVEGKFYGALSIVSNKIIYGTKIEV